MKTRKSEWRKIERSKEVEKTPASSFPDKEQLLDTIYEQNHLWECPKGHVRNFSNTVEQKNWDKSHKNRMMTVLFYQHHPQASITHHQERTFS